MKCPDCIAQLQSYVDGELVPNLALEFENHVACCPACRAQLSRVQTLVARVADLPREIPPSHDLWADLKAKLLEPSPAAEPRSLNSGSPVPRIHSSGSFPASMLLRWFAPVGVAAAAALMVTLAERGLSRSPSDAWSVATLSGTPRVNARMVRDEAQFRVGQWLETDAESRAKVAVGNIGEVTVDPNSRLRLIGMAATDHRLELARGSMRAFIWAPPRLFFVNTPSATAVDLGCQYTLTVDEHGDGELHVLTGYVALEHGRLESIIPMGMMCLTRRESGPGTPFASDAPPELRAALTRFDFERGAAPTALPEILGHARTGDAVTLWHLLARTTVSERAAVYDTLAKLSTPPDGVTRAGILAGDVGMRQTWAAALGLDFPK